MSAAPLAGRTVVELCQNVAGPYTGLVLAQLGARVIKVERPGRGDDTRGWQPPAWGPESAMFATMNAGKESIALDLRDTGDAALLWRLIERSDVLLASWRPGSLERLGFGAEAIAARAPRLIRCAITAFGTTGPLAAEPGYDPLIQAAAGLMAVTGHEGAEPVRVGTSIIDMGTGMWAVIGVLGALLERERTGAGGAIDTALYETGLAWLPYQIAGRMATGVEPRPMGSGMPMLVPYQAFATADGEIVIAAGNDALWQRLCAALDREDLGGDPALATNPQRVAARERVVDELTATLATRGAAAWEECLREAGVPAGAVRTVGEALAHPQTAATGIVGAVAHEDLPGFRLLGLPLLLAGARPRPGARAPRLDEHGDALRRELATR